LFHAAAALQPGKELWVSHRTGLDAVAKRKNPFLERWVIDSERKHELCKLG
jgi:hypothetical protein